MWRQLLTKMGVAVHPRLDRVFITSKQCHGIVCQDPMPRGSLLAVIPFWCCPAPNIAAASPWGVGLQEVCCEAIVRIEDGVKVEYSQLSLLTMSFLAFAMLPGSPIKAYLDFITVPERGGQKEFEKLLSAEQCKQLAAIRNINNSILESHHERLTAAGLDVPLVNLQASHSICESRCVDVPDSELVLGGPALVPLVDLINHDNCTPNVVTYLASDHEIRREASSDAWSRDCCELNTPFFVVLRCASDVGAGEELSYRYVDPAEDSALFDNALYWASRFHFIPPAV